MMNEGAKSDSSEKGVIERFDALMKRASDRRKESIRRSLERPLKLEMIRTAFLIGCMLFDLVLLPIGVIGILGHDLLFISFLAAIPLIYIQYKIHRRFFAQ